MFYATTMQSRFQKVVKSNIVSLRHKHSPETLFIHTNQCIGIVLAFTVVQGNPFCIKIIVFNKIVFSKILFLKILFFENFIKFYLILFYFNKFFFFRKIYFIMNSVHLLTQEKYRVEKIGLKIKSSAPSAHSWPVRAPRPRAQHPGRAPAVPLLRTPRAPLPALFAPAPVRSPTHARPACCRAHARSSTPRACAHAAQRPCRLRALPSA